jgi:hypothetical protein
MLNEFSSIWAILTRLTDLVLWIIAQLSASINTINDHESRIDELEQAVGAGGDSGGGGSGGGGSGGGGSGGGGSGGGDSGSGSGITVYNTITNNENGDVIGVGSAGIVFVDTSDGPVHVSLANPTASTTNTPVVSFVCVDASNDNSITAPIRDAVGNALTNIKFLVAGQSITLAWHAPSTTWFVVGVSFSGTLATP